MDINKSHSSMQVTNVGIKFPKINKLRNNKQTQLQIKNELQLNIY